MEHGRGEISRKLLQWEQEDDRLRKIVEARSETFGLFKTDKPIEFIACADFAKEKVDETGIENSIELRKELGLSMDGETDDECDNSNTKLSESLKLWAVRNNVADIVVDDLLETLRANGVSDVPYTFGVLEQRDEQSATTVKQNVEYRVDKNLSYEMQKNFEATYKRLCENSVYLVKINKKLEKMFGGATSEEEIFIESRLPIMTLNCFIELEDVLGSEKYQQAFKVAVGKLTPLTSVEIVFKAVITDECLILFNWEGTFGKRALKSSIIFSKLFMELFPTSHTQVVVMEIKRCVDRAHRRHNSKKRKRKAEGLNKE